MQEKLNQLIDEAIMRGESRAASGIDHDDHSDHTDEGYCAFAWG